MLIDLSRPAAWLLVLSAMLSAGGARAQRRELDLVTDDLNLTGVKLKTLVDEFQKEEDIDAGRPYAARFADAEILFLLGDYPRASLLLFDLAEDRADATEETFSQVLYYLAEAQYQMGNDLAARDYFQKVVERRVAERIGDAIKRLIELADRMERWEGVDAQVDLLRRQGRLPPSIAYIHAKSLLRQGKLDQVASAASDVPSVHPIYPKARYLTAVALLRQGKHDEARALFESLTGINDAYDQASQVRDLAAMNHGRILLEQEKLPESADAYQFIQRDSPLFEEALYEITWLYVRAAHAAPDEATRTAEYQKALKAIEILLLSEQAISMAPEARLLLGNILLRLGRYEEAADAFNQVVERYAPVRDELIRLADSAVDPASYYEDIVARSKAGGGLLPPLAIKWAAEQKRLKKALAVVADLDEGESWIAESKEVVDKLMRVLSSEQRAQFVPTLQEAQARMLELDNTLVAVSQRLLVIEREVVGQSLDPAKKAELDALLAERAVLEPEYRKLPQSREEYEGRLSAMQGRMLELQKRAYRLRWDIEEMRRTIDGLARFMESNPGVLDGPSTRDVHDRIAQSIREIAMLEELQKELEAQIATERNMINVTTAEGAREEELRARYVATLDREREILAVGMHVVTGEQQQLLGQIGEDRELMARYHAELTNFKARLARVINRKAFDMKADLLKEQAMLESFVKEIGEAKGAAKRVVGEIAIGSLDEVQKNFRAIVLRGDVGIVDVAWALKEEQTHAISRRVSDQNKELQILDAEFRQVLEE